MIESGGNMLVSSNSSLKRNNPHSSTGFPQKKQKRDVPLAHFESPLRSLGIKDLEGKDLSDKSIKIIAVIAYDIFFCNRKTPLVMNKITKHEPLKNFFYKVVSSKKNNYCVFITRRLLGKGTSKAVYEAVLIEMDAEKKLNSIKVSSVALLSFKNRNNVSQNALREDQLAGLFHSPYIIEKSIHRIKTKSTCCLLQNRFAFDFEKAISKNMLPPLNQTICALGDAAEGLGLLHAKDVIHRDIKPANLALNIDGRGLVFDLGLAEFSTKLINVAGSPLYIAPELFQDGASDPECLDDCCQGPQSPETDLWAFGVSLYEILSPNHALPGMISTLSLYDSLGELRKTLLEIKEERKIFHAELFKDWKANDLTMQKIQEIIRMLLSINPKKRGTAMELSDGLRACF